MKRLGFAVGISFATSCHTAPNAPQPGDAGSVPTTPMEVPERVAIASNGPTAASPIPGSSRSQVQLSWRLAETRRWLDSQGEEHQSSIVELLIQGGTPSHVQLGRRETFGCTVEDETASSSLLTGLDCYDHAHGEYATVERSRPGELRIEAFGQNEAYPDYEPPRTNIQSATAQIPSESAIVIDPELVTIPSDAPARSRPRDPR